MKHFLARAAPWKIQKSLHSHRLEESKEREFERKEVEQERRRDTTNLSKNETERPNHAARPGLARPIAPSLRKDEQKRRHVVLQSNANVPRVTPGRDRRGGRARGREHL